MTLNTRLRFPYLFLWLLAAFTVVQLAIAINVEPLFWFGCAAFMVGLVLTFGVLVYARAEARRNDLEQRLEVLRAALESDADVRQQLGQTTPDNAVLRRLQDDRELA